MGKIMQAQDLCETLARFYNARDLDGLVSLYEEGAVLRYGFYFIDHGSGASLPRVVGI